jgi:IclR family KDG regulon transcriptional repressor
VVKTIPSVIRTFKVLDLFLKGTRSLSVPEIVSRLNYPRTTAYEIVNTLLESGYLTRDESQSNKVTLGFKLFELGSAYADQFDLISEGRKIAAQNVEKCDETCQIAIRNNTEVVFIAKVDCSQALRLVSSVGIRLPAHCTSVGKMLLSALTNEEINELYDGKDELIKMTENSITSVSKLIQELEIIRRRALAFDNCESNTDASCIAAPIYNHGGDMVAAMSFTVPTNRMKTDKQEQLSRIIREGAEKLSKRLGFGTGVI